MKSKKPVVKNLRRKEEARQACEINNIMPRYPGKTFIGNHCDTDLKEETYNGVLGGMVDNSDIIEQAEGIQVLLNSKDEPLYQGWDELHTVTESLGMI